MATEKCVVCQQDTGVEDDIHVDMRHMYIEGVGQTCPDCYYKAV